MCSIYGAIGTNPSLNTLMGIRERAKDRGREGGRMEMYHLSDELLAYLGNWRATPTPEIEKAPLQPYDMLVHNGTISNDKELKALPREVDSQVLPRCLDRTSLQSLVESLSRVVGSYAIGTVSKDKSTVFLACNYKPIHYAELDGTIYFSSMARHFDGVLPFGHSPTRLEPYSAIDLRTHKTLRIPRKSSNRAIVVCSGGLDSTVVATALVRDKFDVCLLHFRYGCHAETKESVSVVKIAESLECSYKFLSVPYTFAGDSSLLVDKDIAGPVEGAEYAHEWVPARNLVFLSLAIAYAEANGFHYVALGNNLEEAGAYPDNEEQFTDLLDQVASYAVQNGHLMRVLSPVGNLMKHEIVKLGLSIDAPLHLTWSCYKHGDQHCGNCGPCFMRQEAFRRNGVEDPVFSGA